MHSNLNGLPKVHGPGRARDCYFTVMNLTLAHRSFLELSRMALLKVICSFGDIIESRFHAKFFVSK